MAPDEAPGRLLAMLQPLRLLESSWSVDIAGELAGYHEELSSLDFEVDGITGLDFTDAALVVCHSSCTYSKKVEHLRQLTMSALESSKMKRKTKKGNSRDKKVPQSIRSRLCLCLCCGDCRRYSCGAHRLKMQTPSSLRTTGARS